MPAWPDERTDQLKKLWADGCSAGQIAAELGEVTRNAVIGKVHRLGLPEHPNAVARRISGAARRRERLPGHLRFMARKIARQLEQIIPLPDPTPTEVLYDKGLTFFDLEPHHCRYVVSGEYPQDFQFCGNRKQAGCSYCPGHRRMTHRTAPTRSRSHEVARFFYLKNIPTEKMLHALDLKEGSDTS
jgi:GcrA cell cycle regulator